MRFHDRVMVSDFPATLAEIPDELFAAIELGPGWLVAIEISHQTNSQSNVVQIIAVNVAAIDLPSPTVPHFNLTVPGGCAVADYEMVSQPVLHSSKMTMVIIESGSVSLTSAAVMDHDVLPTAARYWSSIDLSPNRSRQITIASATAAASSSAAE